MQRAYDLRQLLDPELAISIKDIKKRLDQNLDLERRAVIESLFTRVLQASGQIPVSWPKDLIFETQGLGGHQNNDLAAIGELQRLMMATSVNGLIEGEAIALPSADGPIVIACYRSSVADIHKILVPLIVHRDRQVSFMLTPFGVTVPLAGLNSAGLVIARVPPEYRKEAFKEAVGPDAGVQCRKFLLNFAYAGFQSDNNSDGNFVGSALRFLTEPPNSVLTRPSTPGILLAADKSTAILYQWVAGAQSETEASTPVEFLALGKPDLQGGPPPLLATGTYSLAPFREDNSTTASKLLSEVDSMGPGDFTRTRIERLLGSQDSDTLCVAFFPGTGLILLSTGQGKVTGISLPRATGLTW